MRINVNFFTKQHGIVLVRRQYTLILEAFDVSRDLPSRENPGGKYPADPVMKHSYESDGLLSSVVLSRMSRVDG